MFCPACRREIPDGAPVCAFCGARFDAGAPPAPAPRTSGMAIASFVLGLLGVLCVTAIAGLALGILSLVQIRGSQGRLKGQGWAIAGICLSALMPIFILPAIALPGYFAAIHQGRVRACQSNFKIINIACQAYFAQNKEWPSEVTDMLDPANPQSTTPAGLKGGQLTELPICPFATATDPKPYELVEIHEDPYDAMSPIVGVQTDWNEHWVDSQWQNAQEHVP